MNYLTPIFAFIIALLCFWMSAKLIRLYLRVRKWDRVNATLISKEVILYLKYSTPKAPYGLKAEYAYKVGGVDTIGHTLYLAELAGGQVNMMKSDAEKRLSKLEQSLSIFVNPKDSKQSVVYCEGIGLYIFIFCMGLLSCLIGIGALLS